MRAFQVFVVAYVIGFVRSFCFCLRLCCFVADVVAYVVVFGPVAEMLSLFLMLLLFINNIMLLLVVVIVVVFMHQILL